MDLSMLDEEQGEQPIENKDIKIKLLDDLIEKIMSLPDESKETQADENAEAPDMQSLEEKNGLEQPLKGFKA